MDKVRQKGFLGEKVTFSYCLAIESKKGEKRENSKILSSIYRFSSIGIPRAKSERSSTRQGLRMGTKKRGISPKIEMRRFREIKFSGLGGVLEISFSSTTLQEVIRFYSYFCLFILFYELKISLEAVWTDNPVL